jgi:hypothetical protein
MPILSRPLPMATRGSKRQSNKVTIDLESINNPNHSNTDGTCTPPTKKDKVGKYAHLSPTTRKVKKKQLAVAVDAAFNLLLAYHAANGGKQTHNDIATILEEYKKKDFGCEVERHHIEYRMLLHTKKKKTKEQNKKPTTIIKTQNEVIAITTLVTKNPHPLLLMYHYHHQTLMVFLMYLG